mmetsp:Transcript_16789/g.36098  ORF Transcript_16789/g.36098 Transcript_16789/m.36098 type:complete len:207 (+) Transcript_16789:1007-1627(+)
MTTNWSSWSQMMSPAPTAWPLSRRCRSKGDNFSSRSTEDWGGSLKPTVVLRSSPVSSRRPSPVPVPPVLVPPVPVPVLVPVPVPPPSPPPSPTQVLTTQKSFTSSSLRCSSTVASVLDSGSGGVGAAIVSGCAWGAAQGRLIGKICIRVISGKSSVAASDMSSRNGEYTWKGYTSKSRTSPSCRLLCDRQQGWIDGVRKVRNATHH